MLESAATCHCDSLNFLFGDLAARYAWLHLAARAGAGPHLKEFVCPTTLVRWLGMESRPGEDRPPMLFRLDSGLTDLVEDVIAEKS